MLNCQRHCIHLPSDITYLNSAYMAPLHKRVVAAGANSYQRQCDPTSLGRAAFFDEVNDLALLFAQLVNAADSSRVAIIPSASYGLSTAAKNLEPETHQNIVVAGDQFPSNYYAWSKACATNGAELRVVAPPMSRTDRAIHWNNRLLEAVDRNTAAVALPNAHWSDGTLFDLLALRTRTHEVGAALVVDGTQSVGVIPIDVDSLGLDALVCSGYKTLLGPYGTAFGFFGPRFDHGQPIEETWLGRIDSDDFANLVDYNEVYRGQARRYEAGGRSNFITMPMMKAALELLLEWTPQRISEYCTAITAELPERLRSQGFWIESSRYRSPQLFGIRPPASMNSEERFQRLDERKIAISLRGDVLRVSPHLFNTVDDLDTLYEALTSP